MHHRTIGPRSYRHRTPAGVKGNCAAAAPLTGIHSIVKIPPCDASTCTNSGHGRCGRFNPLEKNPLAKRRLAGHGTVATNMIKPSLTILLVAFAASGTTVANAEAGNPLTDRFSISLGGFLLNTNTEVRVDGETTQGSTVDIENDLGFDDIDRFRIDGYWRMTPRQKIRVMYFDNKRTENTTIDQDIVFDDQTYAVNTDLEVVFQTTVAELAYEFAFLRGDNYELNATAGIHNLKFRLGIEVTGNNVNASESATAEANGPLPMIGLNGIWRFNDKLYLQAAVQFFKISYDPYDGRLTDLNASLVWQAFRHVGFGAGYNSFTTRVDVTGDDFHGSLKWRYSGARIFVITSF